MIEIRKDEACVEMCHIINTAEKNDLNITAIPLKRSGSERFSSSRI
jgi:hypothetical protein